MIYRKIGRTSANGIERLAARQQMNIERLAARQQMIES
jgi:hypothetical protein